MFEGIPLPGFVVFVGIGYLCGWCFRDIGLLKILLTLLIVSPLFQWVSMIDEMVWVTLPFLAGALLGYWGIQAARYKLQALKDQLTNHLR